MVCLRANSVACFRDDDAWVYSIEYGQLFSTLDCNNKRVIANDIAIRVGESCTPSMLCSSIFKNHCSCLVDWLCPSIWLVSEAPWIAHRKVFCCAQCWCRKHLLLLHVLLYEVCPFSLKAFPSVTSIRTSPLPLHRPSGLMKKNLASEHHVGKERGQYHSRWTRRWPQELRPRL